MDIQKRKLFSDEVKAVEKETQGDLKFKKFFGPSRKLESLSHKEEREDY